MTQALDPTGSIRSLRVDSEGKLLVTGIAGGGGGGTGDASAANQLIQTERLDSVVTQTAAIASAIKAEDAPHSNTDKGIHALAVRQDVDAVSATADNDYASLLVDEEGRLKTSAKAATFPVVAGSITAAGSAAANIVAVDVSRAGAVAFGIVNTGTATMVAGTFTFEVSLDSTDGIGGRWQIAQCRRNNVSSVETSYTAANLAAGAGHTSHWRTSVDGVAWFRVRCLTAPTGSAVATWTIRRAVGSGEIVPMTSLGGNQPVVGGGTHAAPISGGPVRLGARALNADYAALTTGQTADLKASLGGALIVALDAIPENTWYAAAASGGITTTTATVVKAAPAAGVRNYIKSAQFRNAGAAQTEVMILDGATVIWRSQVVSGTADGVSVLFDPPIRCAAASAVSVQCSAASAVYANLQGFVGY